MSPLRGLGALVRAQLTETVRSKTALFWTLAFPLIFLFVFGFVFAGGRKEGATFLMPGLLTISVLSGSFFGVAMRMVVARETGALRRLRVTPVTAVAVVLSYGAVAFVTLSLTVAVQLLVARAVFKITVAGPLFSLVLALVAGFLAFVPLGLFVGSVARDSKTAPAITNLIFFPTMFLSGAAFPFAFLPEWIQRIGRLLPATYLVDLLQGVIVRNDSARELAGPAAVLLLTFAVGMALNALLFRWQTDDPISGRNLGIATLGLAAVFISAALFSPELAMRRLPSSRTPAEGQARGQTRLLRGVTVLDGLGGRTVGADVVLRGNRVTEIRAGKGPPPAGASVDALDGFFLIPGLIDSHVHLGGSGGGSASGAEFSPERQVHDLQAYLGLGVTAIVSLADEPGAMRRLREASWRARMRAPRVFFSGPGITAPGGHPAAMFARVPGLAERLTRQVTTPEDAVKAVDEAADMDADLVKLFLEAGEIGHAVPRLAEPAFRAAVHEAKQRRLRTTVHVQTDADVRLALECGVDGIEHVPPDISDDTLHLMAERRVTLTPTLSALDGFRAAFAREAPADPLTTRWVSPSVTASLLSPQSWLEEASRGPGIADGMAARLKRSIDAVGRAARAGVTILAGSDSGNAGTFHGPGLIRELQLLASAGLTPAQVLRAATSLPADRLGDKEIGRIAPGTIADLVVLGSDPERDVAAFRDVRAVYLNGLPLDRDHLLDTPAGSWSPER